MSYFNTSDNSHLSDPKSDANFKREIDFTPNLKDYIQASISANTVRAYRSDMEHFLSWGGTVPAEPGTVAEYLASQAGHLAVSTLRRRVAAISAIHEAKGLPNPTNTKLIKATLRGIQRAHGVPQNQVSPLLVEDLTHIICLMGNDVKSLRNKALLLIGFAGGLRRSELVALDRDDIEVARQGIIVTIRRSKTDQLGEGRRIGIPNARGPHCPALSLEKWLQRIPDSPGPIFRPVTKAGQIRDTRLSTEAIAKIVKGAVTLIGLDSASYSGHSLRAGLATSAAMHGVSTIAIRRQTGHASDSMLARYVRSGELFMNNAVGALL
ncbi:site-specific integrase [Hwanghaeella sp. LZ110]|uniref:site-specific integrase n=1 Tax=Hwanghaeella sp. LZ110 TaxID=3402810 RepID=UPI003B66BAA0